MDFEKKLDDLLKKDRFIEEDGHYAFLQLSKLFLEGKSLDKNIDFLLQSLDKNIEEDWIWSFVRFLEENLGKSRAEFTQKQKDKIGEWSLKKLENIEKFGVTTVLKILDVLFEVNPDAKEQLKVLEPIVENSEEYQILQNIILQLHEGDEYDELFIDVLLKTLNANKGNYLGIGYLSKVFIRLGKSSRILYFLDQIKEDRYSKALEEFLGMYEKSAKEFFAAIGKNKKEIIKRIGDLLGKAGMRGIWYGNHAHRKEEFLKIFLNTTHELGLSLFDEQSWLFDDSNFWHIYSFLAPFISFEDLRKYHEKVGNTNMNLIRLYEVVRNLPEIRSDRTKILEQFLSLPGFKEHYAECEKTWEKERVKMQKTTEKYKKQERDELKKMISMREEDKVLAGLVDKFYRELKSETKQQESLFGTKEIKIVKEEIEKFFKWDLFNLEKPVYEEYTKEDGTKEYRGGYWYQVEFFKNALDLWKNTFNESTTPFRTKILKSLLLVDTSHVKEVAEYLGDNIKLSDDESEMFLSSLRKENISKARYHLSGQNIIDVFDLFKGSFEKKKFRKSVQEILWSILEDDYYYSFRRVEAISWAHENNFIDQEWLQKIKSYWNSLIEKDKNYIENFSDEDVIFGINRVLIEMEDEEAILWRINQLKTAKIALSEQETENAQGGIANEIRGGKHLFKCLENIDFKKYGDAIFELIETGLKLLQKDEKNLVKNLSPYGRYIIFNALNIMPLGIEELKKVKKIISKYSGDARKYGGIIWRKKYQELLDKILEIEDIKIGKEISVNKTQYNTEVIAEKDKEIQKLKNEVRTLKKSLEEAQQYKQETEQPENLVIIEGYTGVIHLQNAWNALRPGKKMPFVLQDGFDSQNIGHIMLKPQELGGFKKIIGVLDLDGEGLKSWHGCHKIKEEGGDKYIYERKQDRFSEKLCMTKECIYKEEKRYALLLPLTDEAQLPHIKESWDEKSAWFYGAGLEKRGDFCLAIEEMFFDHGKPNWILELINKKYFKENGSFAGSKKNFGGDLQLLISNNIVSAPEVYKNFEPLLQKIEAIIKESNK